MTQSGHNEPRQGMRSCHSVCTWPSLEAVTTDANRQHVEG